MILKTKADFDSFNFLNCSLNFSVSYNKMWVTVGFTMSKFQISKHRTPNKCSTFRKIYKFGFLW